MEQFKKAKVVMLPKLDTAENVPILKNINNRSNQRLYPATKGYYYTQDYLKKEDFEAQHLYIISDDEIKKGNYALGFEETTKDNPIKNVEPYLVTDVEQVHWDDKKIIATTDISLKKPCTCIGMRTQVSCDWICETHKDYFLPQPSQEFIEYYIREYNKGNVISDVLVEYDSHPTIGEIIDNIAYPGKEIEFLKVNPKDNTITIKQLKNNWSREEVIELLYKHTENLLSGYRSTLEQWIEENL
jgi:hypothetical protein